MYSAVERPITPALIDCQLLTHGSISSRKRGFYPITTIVSCSDIIKRKSQADFDVLESVLLSKMTCLPVLGIHCS